MAAAIERLWSIVIQRSSTPPTTSVGAVMVASRSSMSMRVLSSAWRAEPGESEATVTGTRSSTPSREQLEPGGGEAVGEGVAGEELGVGGEQALPEVHGEAQAGVRPRPPAHQRERAHPLGCGGGDGRRHHRAERPAGEVERSAPAASAAASTWAARSSSSRGPPGSVVSVPPA
jgi:hypothetical protein